MVRDKKVRNSVNNDEKLKFVFKTIERNLNFFRILRWNAGFNTKKISYNSSKTRISNRCILTISKKRLNKLSNFSRIIFLEKVRSGNISGVQKSCW